MHNNITCLESDICVCIWECVCVLVLLLHLFITLLLNFTVITCKCILTLLYFVGLALCNVIHVISRSDRL